MAKYKPTKIVSKKHLARQEREQRQTRIITGVATGIVVLVVLLIAYGLLNDTLFLNWRPAVTVNGESLSLNEFQFRVQATRQSLIGQYLQYVQLAQMFGMDPNSDPQLSQTLQQITSQLDSSSALGGQVINDMTDDLIIRQYAKANGITVSAADVETAIRGALNYYPNGTPSPTLTPTELTYPTWDATQMAIITPTPTSTSAPTTTALPTSTPDLTATATPIPSITPTATPYTFQEYQSNYEQLLKTYSTSGIAIPDPKSPQIIQDLLKAYSRPKETKFRKIYYESGLYQERVKAKVTADITHEQEQVWARHILVADEATAKDIRTQLEAGADFATLAAKYSIDTGTKDKGGDLGWFGRGAMVAEFETAAFSMKVGEISQPVKTTYGYHIIQVLGHQVRPLSDTDYQTAVTAAFNKWLQDQRSKAKIVINSSWTNFVPMTPSLAGAEAAGTATQTAYIATYLAQKTPTK